MNEQLLREVPDPQETLDASKEAGETAARAAEQLLGPYIGMVVTEEQVQRIVIGERARERVRFIAEANGLTKE